jgi:hypothetical protein
MATTTGPGTPKRCSIFASGPVIVSLHGRIVGDTAERGVDHFARDAVVDRDLLEGFEPIVESFGACAAFGGARGRRAKDGRHYGREDQGFQISSSHRQLQLYHKSLGTRSAREARRRHRKRAGRLDRA